MHAFSQAFLKVLVASRDRAMDAVKSSGLIVIIYMAAVSLSFALPAPVKLDSKNSADFKQVETLLASQDDINGDFTQTRHIQILSNAARHGERNARSSRPG